MKKVIFYMPAILFAGVFGLLTISFGFGSTSPIVIVWIVLFLVSGFLLNKEKFWGAIFGMLPGIHWIYMSTKDTGQAIDIELPFGVIILIFHIICSVFILYKKSETKRLF